MILDVVQYHNRRDRYYSIHRHRGRDGKSENGEIERNSKGNCSGKIEDFHLPRMILVLLPYQGSYICCRNNLENHHGRFGSYNTYDRQFDLKDVC